MRRFLPIASYFTMMCVLFGTLFKLMHWPGADEMVIAGLGSVIFLIPFYFIVRIKDMPSFIGKFAYFSLIFSSCVSILGVLFKIMDWPGAADMCVIGIGSLIFPSLFFYAIFQIKKSNNNFKESYYGFFGILLFCLLVVSFAYKNTFGLAETFDYSYRLVETNNLKLMSLLDTTNLRGKNIELKREILKTIDEIEELKLIVKKEAKIEKYPNDEIRYRINDQNVGTRILVNDRGRQLFEKINGIHKELQKINENQNGLIFLNQSMSRKNREFNQFGQHPTSGILSKLTCFQNDLILSYMSLD